MSSRKLPIIRIYSVQCRYVCRMFYFSVLEDTPIYMCTVSTSFLRKKLGKGVLLPVHFNFCLALLIALLVFVTGLQTAVNIPVSRIL